MYNNNSTNTTDSMPCNIQSSCILRRLCLIDFGLSSTCVDIISTQMLSSTISTINSDEESYGTVGGTSIYIAPELLSTFKTKVHPVHTYTKSDIFSIGITLLYDV